MKTRRLPFLFAAAFAAVTFTFSSCSRGCEEPVEPANQQLLTTEYELEDLNQLESPEMADASADRNMDLVNDQTTQERGPCASAHHALAPNHGPDRFPQLGRILHALNLTADQRTQVRTFLHDYCACATPHLRDLHLLRRQIIEHGNQERAELVRDFRSGLIDRATFEQRMRELNHRIREALRNSPGIEAELNSIRECRHHLFEQISGILDEHQLEMWHNWLQHHR